VLAAPLRNVRVIDASAVIAVPYAIAVMADMGAEVLKIEAPHRASPRNASFDLFNRGKRGIALDLTTSEGVKLFKELVSISDVVVENYTPRVMRNFGLDYNMLRQVRPDIIMLSNTGFGQTGPWQNYMAFGAILDPMCGISACTGYEDGALQKVGEAHLDFTVCWTAIFAIMAALHHRRATGQGQYIDLSMYEASVSSIGQVVMDASVNHRDGMPQPRGNKHSAFAPHGCYPCAGDDAWVTIAVTNDHEWEALCCAMGRSELATDPRFMESMSRYGHQDELDPIISAWTTSLTHYEVMHRLQQVGVPAGAVLNAEELVVDPHLKHRGFYELLEPSSPPPGVAALPQIGRAWKMSETPGTVRAPAPRAGQHSASALRELLAVGPEEFAALAVAGVVCTGPTGAAAAPPAGGALTPEEQLRLGLAAAYVPDFLRVLNEAFDRQVLGAPSPVTAREVAT
jgi:crotonobetainyl-CoA:carnitine CoA-transferase CaiB-like acyl-CoA transferase